MHALKYNINRYIFGEGSFPCIEEEIWIQLKKIDN